MRSVTRNICTLMAASSLAGACSFRQQLPDIQVIDFYEKTYEGLLLCKLDGLNSISKRLNVLTGEFIAKELPGLVNSIATGKSAPSNKPPDMKPFLEAAEKDFKACAEPAMKDAEELWPKAVAQVKDEAEGRRLNAYYAEWNEALEAQRPQLNDFVFPYSTKRYWDRADAADKKANRAWKEYLLAAMSSDHFCTSELSKLASDKDEEYWRTRSFIEYSEYWRTRSFVEHSARVFDVSADDVESIKRKDLKIGMSKCAALAVWGKPSETKNVTKKNVIYERLVYEYNKLLVFENGNLASISR